MSYFLSVPQHLRRGGKPLVVPYPVLEIYMLFFAVDLVFLSSSWEAEGGHFCGASGLSGLEAEKTVRKEVKGKIMEGREGESLARSRVKKRTFLYYFLRKKIYKKRLRPRKVAVSLVLWRRMFMLPPHVW